MDDFGHLGRFGRFWSFLAILADFQFRDRKSTSRIEINLENRNRVPTSQKRPQIYQNRPQISQNRPQIVILLQNIHVIITL